MKTTAILLLLSILSVSLALNYPVRGDIKRTLKSLDDQGMDRPHCPPGEDCRPPRDDDHAKRLDENDTAPADDNDDQEDGQGPQDGEHPPRRGRGPRPDQGDDAKRLEERRRHPAPQKRLDDAAQEDDGEGPADGEHPPRRGGRGPRPDQGDDAKRLEERRRHPAPQKRLSMNHPEAEAFCARLKTAWGTCGAEMGCDHSWDECSASAECMRVATRMYGMRDSGNGTCHADDAACLRDQEDWNDANGCLADHELAQEDDNAAPEDDGEGPAEGEERPPRRMRGQGPPAKRLEERRRHPAPQKRLDDNAAPADEDDDHEGPAEGEERPDHPRRGGRGPRPDQGEDAPAKRLDADAADSDDNDEPECPEPQHDDDDEAPARMLAKRGGKPPRRGCGKGPRPDQGDDSQDAN